jgi:hypothetical protein
MPISYDTGAMTNYDLGRRRNLLDLAKFLDDPPQRDPRQQMQMQSRMAQERGNEELRRMRMQKKFADQQRIDDLGAEQAKKGASLRELDKNWMNRLRAAETQGLYGSPVPLAMDQGGGITRLDEIEQGKQAIDFLSIAGGGGGGGGGGLAGQMEDIYGKETPEEEAARRAFAGVKAGYLSPQEKQGIETRESFEREQAGQAKREQAGLKDKMFKLQEALIKNPIMPPEQRKFLTNEIANIEGELSGFGGKQQEVPGDSRLQVSEEGGKIKLSNSQFKAKTGYSKAEVETVARKAETVTGKEKRFLKPGDRQTLIEAISKLTKFDQGKIAEMSDKDLGKAYRRALAEGR